MADRGARRAKASPPGWPLTPELVARWEETFPGMDVLGEARKAREWLLANHLKTYNGMSAYLFRWLCRAQNSGRFLRRTAAPSTPQRQTLEEAYGFASWDEWEETLRKYFEGQELEEEMGKLGKLRAQWEEAGGL